MSVNAPICHMEIVAAVLNELVLSHSAHRIKVSLIYCDKGFQLAQNQLPGFDKRQFRRLRVLVLYHL